jgi:hypothetical protein
MLEYDLAVIVQMLGELDGTGGAGQERASRFYRSAS